MSIFKTGLTLSPDAYLRGAKSATDLRALQDANQRRIDATEVLERTEAKRGDFVNQAPDLSAPDSAGLRRMMDRNVDGSYGTDASEIKAPEFEPKAPTASVAAIKTADNPIQAEKERAGLKFSGVFGDFAFPGQDPSKFLRTKDGDAISMYDYYAPSFLGGGQQPFDQTRGGYFTPGAGAASQQFSTDYAPEVGFNPVNPKSVPSGADSTINRNTLDGRNYKRMDNLISPELRTGAIEQGIADRAGILYENENRAKREYERKLKDFQEKTQVTIDNTGRVTKADSEGESTGVEIGRRRADSLLLFERESLASGIELEQAIRKATNEKILNDNYFKKAADVGKEVKDVLEDRRDLAFSAQQYYALAQVALNTGGVEDYRKNMEIAEAYKSVLKKTDDQIVYLEGMQSLNELKQGRTGRASKVASLYNGVDTQIIKRDDDKFDIVQMGDDGLPTTIEAALSLDNVSKTLRLLFDSKHRSALTQANIENAKLAFKSQLKTKEELSKILAETKKEAMLKRYDALLDDMKRADPKLEFSTFDGKVFVKRGEALSIIKEVDFLNLNGETETQLVEESLAPGSTGYQQAYSTTQ